MDAIKIMRQLTPCNRAFDCQRSSESELEFMFWHFLSKCPDSGFMYMEPQVKVCGFRLDALIVTAFGCRIGIELDGSQFHDPQKDFNRDMAILSSGKVDEIIRIQSLAVLFHDRAFLRPMQEWHRCFQCTQDVWTVSLREWSDILMSVECDMDTTVEDFIDENESNYSIWTIQGNDARVASPSWISRESPRDHVTRYVRTRMRL